MIYVKKYATNSVLWVDDATHPEFNKFIKGKKHNFDGEELLFFEFDQSDINEKDWDFEPKPYNKYRVLNEVVVLLKLSLLANELLFLPEVDTSNLKSSLFKYE